MAGELNADMAENAKKKNRSQAPVIVEIGNDWLKIAVFEWRGERLGLAGFHLQKIPGVDSSIARHLKSALEKLKPGRAPVIACLPRQLLNVRMLELPSTSPDEIADMVDLQVAKLTPYSRDEISSDFCITSPSGEGYSKVMVGIAQRATLRERFYIFEDAGVDVDRVSVSTEGLAVWCKNFFGESVCAVIDIDSFYSDLVMSDYGQISGTRSILVGANQLYEDMDTWREKLTGEVRRGLEAFVSGGSSEKPGKLVITGAGARISGLREFMEEQIGLTVEVFDPLDQLGGASKGHDPLDEKYRTVSLTAMAGMAMSPDKLRFNLIPDTAVLKKRLVSRAKSLTGLAMGFMLLAISLTAYGSIKIGLKMAELEEIRRKLAQVKPVADEVERKIEMIRVAKERQDPETAFVSFLAAVHEAMPEDIYIEQLSFDRSRSEIMVDGVGARVDISRFVANLQKKDIFSEVTERNTRSDSQSGRYRFQIMALMEKK